MLAHSLQVRLSVLLQSSLLRRPATWVSLSTRIRRCRTMSSELSRAASACYDSCAGTDRCLPVTGRRVGPQTTWLLQQCAGWATCQLDPASSVGSKRCSTADFRPSPFWTHNRRARQSPQSRRTSHNEQWMTVDSASLYLSSYFTRVADVPSRLRLRSSTSDQLIVCHLTTSLLSAGGPFQFPPQISVTVSLHILPQHRRSRFTGSVLRLLFRRSYHDLRSDGREKS